MEFRDGSLTVRPALATDGPAFASILATPEVSRWWPDYDLARVERELAETMPDEAVYALLDGDDVVGLIQTSEENEPEFRHASIDLFLAPSHQGRGLGPVAIRLIARHLIDDRGHHRLTIDPAAANANAIRAYEKVGFRPVGVLRQYQRFPDGTWQDGLLMELLAEELR